MGAILFRRETINARQLRKFGSTDVKSRLESYLRSKSWAQGIDGRLILGTVHHVSVKPVVPGPQSGDGIKAYSAVVTVDNHVVGPTGAIAGTRHQAHYDIKRSPSKKLHFNVNLVAVRSSGIPVLLPP